MVVNFETFGGNFSTVLLTLHSSCQEGKLKGKSFLDNCSWVFFGSSVFSQKDIGLLAKFSSRGVKNAFHESRVPFRENFFTAEMNFLIDNFAKLCGWSQTFGWKFSACLLKRHSSCRDDYFELFLNKIFFYWFLDLEVETFGRCRKNFTGFVKPHFSSPEENFRSFVGK